MGVNAAGAAALGLFNLISTLTGHRTIGQVIASAMSQWVAQCVKYWCFDPWNAFVRILADLNNLTVGSTTNGYSDTYPSVMGSIFDNGIWDLMSGIGIATAVILFLIGIFRQETESSLPITMELVVRDLLRLILIVSVIGLLPQFIAAVLNIGNSLSIGVTSAGNGISGLMISDEEQNAALAAVQQAVATNMTQTPDSFQVNFKNIVGLIASSRTFGLSDILADFFVALPMIIMSIALGIGVIGSCFRIAKAFIMRLYHVMAYVVIAPVAVAGYTGPDDEWQSVARGWVRNFFGYSIELAVFMLVLVIAGQCFGSISSTLIQTIQSSDEANGNVLTLLCAVLPIFCTSAAVTEVPRLLGRALGMQGME